MAAIRSLIAHGIDTVFGLPGGQLDHLFDALYHERDRLRLIASRHEQGAAYMAFGYARSTGRPSVYTVVPGPGVLNTTAACARRMHAMRPCSAWPDRSPRTPLARGSASCMSCRTNLATLRLLTKWAARIEPPAATPGIMAHAFASSDVGTAAPGGAGNGPRTSWRAKRKSLSSARGP